MSDYFRSLVADAREWLEEFEGRPDVNRALLNDARSAIHMAEKLVDSNEDRTLHFAFKAHMANARKAMQMMGNEHAVKRERNRVERLPKATERHELWQEIAAEIREAKPYIKSKTEIARQVRQRLSRSHDDEVRKAALSVDTIRKVI